MQFIPIPNPINNPNPNPNAIPNLYVSIESVRTGTVATALVGTGTAPLIN